MTSVSERTIAQDACRETAEPLGIAGALLLTLSQHIDVRGSFCEIWNERRAAANGIRATFLQDNLVTTQAGGTLRGLHFQRPPAAQAKLVQVLSGAVIDYIVDLRHGSPTYGRSLSLQLDAGGGRQVFVPVGCAHGYCTLRGDTTVLYKVAGAYYSPQHEDGLLATDPSLCLDLPLPPAKLILNARDRAWPRFDALPAIFRWAGS